MRGAVVNGDNHKIWVEGNREVGVYESVGFEHAAIAFGHIW